MMQMEAQDFLVAMGSGLPVEDGVGYFSNQLSELLRDRTQQPVADVSGLARGTVSLYASGARNISVDALERLLKAFADPAEKFMLVRAFLLDQVPASQFAGVTIEPKRRMLQEAAALYGTIDKDLGAALAALQQAAVRDADVRKVLLDLARIVR